jgi:cytoplasmic iron level regulating protein YaaA (DUF328/UPF0246 family)
MLILISPAKTLDFDSPIPQVTATQPVFLEQSEALVKRLRQLSPDGIASLMHISAKLGELNYERFIDWQTPFTKKNARPALLAFKGDVYTGLQAETFSGEDFRFAQQHLRILSGLYGVLRPLDLMQPYRLEMGTRLQVGSSKDLYDFWGDRIGAALQTQLRKLKSDTVINLASNEYYSSVQKDSLQAAVVSPAFKDLKNGDYKIISFYAKKARGQMAGWLIRNQVTDPAELKKFRVGGYRYSAAHSKALQPTFIRDTPA